MFRESDNYGFDGKPVPFRLLKVDRSWVLLSDFGLEQPDVETVLLYDTNCDPKTCLEFQDTTLHLGYVEVKGEEWEEQPPWRPMDEAPPEATHRFRVVTPDVWGLGEESYDEYRAKPARFRRH